MPVLRRRLEKAKPTLFYRFQVTDPRTGEPYYITMSEDGLPLSTSGSDPAANQFDHSFDVAYDDTAQPQLIPAP